MLTLAIFVLVDFENVKMVAEYGWDLFEAEKSSDYNLQLNKYIEAQMKKFDIEYSEMKAKELKDRKGALTEAQ